MRIGPEYELPTADAYSVKWERLRFLMAIRRLVPEVLHDLHQKVYPAFSALADDLIKNVKPPLASSDKVKCLLLRPDVH